MENVRVSAKIDLEPLELWLEVKTMIIYTYTNYEPNE